MKQIKKNFTLLFAIIIFITSSQTVFATDSPTPSTSNTVAEYSLLSNETQTFSLTDENNKPYYITIEPISNMSRMANGDYRVTYTVPNRWTANFIITISSNKMLSVSYPAVIALTGYVTDIALRKDSSTQASLKFLYHMQMVPITAGMKAYISNNSILVQKL